MRSSLIAVPGTLAGVAPVGAGQAWAERRARAEQQGQRVVDAVDHLPAAVVAWRRLHWLLVADLRAGTPRKPGRTRCPIPGPLRDHPGGQFADEAEAALSAGRERAQNAHAALRRAATAYVHRGTR